MKQKEPIIKFKFGEPTMIIRKDGSYVDDYEEWNKIINKEHLHPQKELSLKKKSRKENGKNKRN